jgi:hypothetical protein
MHPNTFRIDGELRAVKSHIAMYSAEVAPVVLAESAAQICWFYYGPHLQESASADRPYPPQKVLVMPSKLVRGFWRMFEPAGETRTRSQILRGVAFA